MSQEVGRKPDQDEVAVVESRMSKRHDQRVETVVGDVSTKVTKQSDTILLT